MARILLLAAALALALAAGCVSISVPEETSTTLETSTEITTTTTEVTTTTPLLCGPKSIPYKDGCCVDRNQNGLCDSGETRASWALATVATTRRTTTTRPPVGCSDGVWNQNEVEVDCGGVCQNDCNLFKISFSDEPVFLRGYGFKLRDSILKEDHLEYALWITTPDGFRDERTVKAGDEGWVDTLKLRLINGTDVSVTIRIWVDKQLVASTPANAVAKTVGGQQCLQKAGGLCTRTYRGYNITMLGRVDNGVRLKVIRPDGVESTGTAWQNGTTYSTLSQQGITIGVLNYVIPGGYSNIYVMPKQTYTSRTTTRATTSTTTSVATTSTTTSVAASSTTTSVETTSTSSQTTQV